MNSSPSSWPGRLLSAAIGLLVAVLLLRWAWVLLRPMLPVLAITAVVVGVGYFIVRHYRRI